ncbi:MAG: glycoside hydrolase family 127 protein [Clostridia bacterium]|nr:glycoside hydrolase family 127 protein [Clostridia bacterium]
MQSVSLKQIKVTDGFLKTRLTANRNNTVYNVYDRFKETGRFDALKCVKEETKSHIFWDSDVAKWIEGACYMLYANEDKNLRALMDQVIDDMVNNQLENGYFNSYFQVYEPDAIFTRRNDHELYCAGHIFEAAVALKDYLNDDRLLNFASKYVDYIIDRFTVKKDTGFVTPGHQEIELALLRLYKLTNEEKYLNLAKFFIDNRGANDKEECSFYNQSHLPVRHQTTAVGHAVRALYLYTAMADMALTIKDVELENAVKTLFDDIVKSKLYVTGGTGSSYNGEKFGIDYNLNNLGAYNETCAAIALCYFADKLMQLYGDAKYGDIIEKVIYNAFMSGVSIDGNSYFYVNPLEVKKDRVEYESTLPNWAKDKHPLLKRVKVFDCSCCPPNVVRFTEEIPSYAVYYDEDLSTITVSQYLSEEVYTPLASVNIDSNFPYDGKVKISVNSYGKDIKLKLRKPSWCKVNFYNEENGYLVFEGVFDDAEIELDFKMSFYEIYANPTVLEDFGKVCFNYGPLVLCAEGTDNDFNILSVKIPKKAKIKGEVLYGDPYVVNANLKVLYYPKTEKLYDVKPPKKIEKTLKLIPYFAWANRDENDMAVWFTKC